MLSVGMAGLGFGWSKTEESVKRRMRKLLKKRRKREEVGDDSDVVGEPRGGQDGRVKWKFWG
jgi:hypothetical protein